MVCERCRSVIQHREGLVLSEDASMLLALSGRDTPPSSPMPTMETYLHHRFAKDLKAAAENGCYICDSLWDTISDEDRVRLIETDPSGSEANNDIGSIATLLSLSETRLFNVFLDNPFDDGDSKRLVCMIRVARAGFNVSPPNRLMNILLALPIDGEMVSLLSLRLSISPSQSGCSEEMRD